MDGHQMLNGVDTTELGKKAAYLKTNPPMAKFAFRAKNKWASCGKNETMITDFTGVGENMWHTTPFKVRADEPQVLVGEDSSPNPVEHLLSSLAACLTTSLVYQAALQGIKIDEVESHLEGDIDVRGFMGLASDVRKGFQNIRATFKVKSDAPQEKLEACARFSPVLDVVSNGTAVTLDIQKY